MVAMIFFKLRIENNVQLYHVSHSDLKILTGLTIREPLADSSQGGCGGASYYCNVCQGSSKLLVGNIDFNLAELCEPRIQARNGPSFIRRDSFNNLLSYWICKQFLLNLFN